MLDLHVGNIRSDHLTMQILSKDNHFVWCPKPVNGKSCQNSINSLSFTEKPKVEKKYETSDDI